MKYAHNTVVLGQQPSLIALQITGEYNSITIDSNDDYHISYSVNSGGNRDVYYKSTGVKENLNNGCGSVSSVAVDSRGERYVICHHQAVWSSAVVMILLTIAIIIHLVGQPQISPTTVVLVLLQHSIQTTIFIWLIPTTKRYIILQMQVVLGFTVIDVPLQGGYYHNVDMVFDSNDNVHISYHDFLLKQFITWAFKHLVVAQAAAQVAVL